MSTVDKTYIFDSTSGNTDDHLVSSSFNTNDGILSLNLLSGGTITQDLDGRYILSGDTSANTDDFVSGATFNTTDGVLTLDRQSGSTVTVDLDGRYLTSEQLIAQTLAFSASTGDLEISEGNTINLDGRYVLSGDTILSSDDYVIGATFNTNDGTLELTRLSGGTVTTNLDNRYSLSGHTHPSDNTDDYVTSGSFNTSTGDVTLTLLSGGTVTYNLDDRYLTGYTETDTLHSVTTRGNVTTNDISVNTLSATSVQFDTNVANGVDVAQMAWNYEDGTINIGMLGGNVTLQVGQELYIHAKAFEDISNGEVVYASGGIGASGRIEVDTYIANNTIEELYLVGVATESILKGEFGFITTFGVVRGLQTNGANYGETWVDGTILYASPTINGGYTKELPIAPNQAISVAIVLNSHSAQGSILVRPTIGSHLAEIHDIFLTGVTDGDVLQYMSGSTRWENISISGLTAKGDTAYSWGNHADFGYLTGATSTDNDYVTTAEFNTVNGELTLTRLSGGTITVDLDNRYALNSELSAHTSNDEIHFVQSAITITESQISDLEDYVLDSELSGHTSDGDIHFVQSAISITESQISDLGTYQPISEKGNASGYAELDVSGKVPLSQLPSYVSAIEEYPDFASFPASGQTGVIYVAIDTNKTYRWSGSMYVEISESLTLGETSDTAYRGDRGKIAYDHSLQTDVHFVQSAISITESQISDLQNYTVVGHTHLKNDITDLTNDISQWFNDEQYYSPLTLNIDLIWDDNDKTIALSPGDPVEITGFSLTGHTHTVSDITDFPTDEIYFNTDDYLTGATFNTINGILSLDMYSGSTVTVDLDGRYLTGYTNTDDYLSGTTFDTNTGDLTSTMVSGNTIVTNLDGRYLTGYTNTDDYLSGGTFNTNTGDLDLSMQSGGTVTINLDNRYSLTGHTHPSDNTDNYLTGTTFNITTGDLTSIMASGDTIVTNLDGRYLTAETDSQTLSFSASTGDLEISNGNIISLDGRYSYSGHSHTESDITDLQDYALDSELSGHTSNDDIHFVQSAISITESQISDLQDYALDSELSAHTSNDDIHFVQSAITITESQISDLQDYSLSGHTHGISDITDFPTNVSYFINDAGYLTGYTNTDDFLTGATFNTNTGDLTLTRLSGGTVITNLDSRYALTGDTSANTDDYLTGTTFNIATGDLTSIMASGNTIVTNLDGRYLTSGADSQTLSFSASTGDLEISGGNIINLDGRYAYSAHTHTESDITDLQDYALDSVVSAHTSNDDIHFVQSAISITESQISDLQNYSLIGHTHLKNDITDLTNDISQWFNDKQYYSPLTLNIDLIWDDNDRTIALAPGDPVEITGFSLSGHTHDASGTTFNPYLTLGSTDVQAAVEELKDEMDLLSISGGTGGGDASGTTFNPYLTIESTNVQDAVEELKDEIDLLSISGGTGLNTDDFLTGATFNTGTGDLDLTMQSGSTIQVNLDDRYFLSGPVTFSCDTVSNTLSYVGYGEVGACKISKIETISGYTYTSYWSEGTEDLDKIWDNRLTYSYF